MHWSFPFQALYASKIISYAQGFMLLRQAAKEFGWSLNYGGIALMWRGGCIIRRWAPPFSGTGSENKERVILDSREHWADCWDTVQWSDTGPHCHQAVLQQWNNTWGSRGNVSLHWNASHISWWGNIRQGCAGKCNKLLWGKRHNKDMLSFLKKSV